MRRRAVYPGTFDPVTNGHLDLIRRSLQLFDEVIVAVAERSTKHPLFDVRERVDLLRQSTKGWRGVRVEAFSGLLVKYARDKQCQCIVRGLRAVADFEYEFQMALMNRKLAANIETIYLMPSEIYTYLSSSIIKEVAVLGGDIKRFVPVPVQKALRERYGAKTKEV